jgi:hypothetical protein
VIALALLGATLVVLLLIGLYHIVQDPPGRSGPI